MRRTKPERREVLPDARYNSVIVQTMIHRIMSRGKKSVSRTLVYDALDIAQTARQPARAGSAWNRR